MSDRFAEAYDNLGLAEKNGHSPASLPSSPYRDKDNDDVKNPGLQRVLWFSRLPTPGPREFLVEALVPARYPTVLHGGGGVAKSVLAMLLGIVAAGGAGDWLGHQVNLHGPVLYADFELDVEEQHRRARALAAGMGVALPEGLGYLCALGIRPQEAFRLLLDACKEHGVLLLILDSLGPAMMGDAEAAKDVILFHNKYLTPFRAAGVTVLIVDHQGKVQAGESYQNKTSFGSAYKEHLARSVIQVEAGRRDKEAGTLTIRVRHRKTNFGVQRDPFDVRLAFGQGKIEAEPVELVGADLAGEATVNAEDRVLHALADGPAFPDELTEATGLATGTVRNVLTSLRKGGRVEDTGEVKGRSRQVRLASSSSPDYRGDE